MKITKRKIETTFFFFISPQCDYFLKLNNTNLNDIIRHRMKYIICGLFLPVSIFSLKNFPQRTSIPSRILFQLSGLLQANRYYLEGAACLRFKSNLCTRTIIQRTSQSVYTLIMQCSKSCSFIFVFSKNYHIFVYTRIVTNI